MNISQLKEQIKKLPAKPGIYLFKSGAKPLYIGKALNLKNRVKSYLKTGDPRLGRMLLEAKRLDFIETGSDIEALILESQYIKKYRPAFNIVLRDDKQYSFIVFTDDKYPKIFTTHQPGSRDSGWNFAKQNSIAKHLEFSLPGQPQVHEDTIGPFTDAGALKTTLRLFRKIFPYCTCTQTHHNYCLNYHIEKCPGYCCLKKSELRITNYELREYRKNIKAIKDILSGKRSSVIKDLEKEMKILSGKQEFEKALELQYKIEKIKRVFENAQIIQRQKTDNAEVLNELKNILNLPELPGRIECYDVANIQGMHAVGAMAVFINGIPDKNEYRKFKIYTKNTPDDTAMLKEVLIRRFRHPEWTYPGLILVDGGVAQFNAARSIASNHNSPITVIAMTKNEKHMGHKIITDGKEILLSELPVSLKNLLLQIDAETHRFAINYYRQIHRRKMTPKFTP